MATRSTITVRINERERLSIYCHYDGYLENNGVILHKYFNCPHKAHSLVIGGDLSVLAKNIFPNTNKKKWRVGKYDVAKDKIVKLKTDIEHSFENKHHSVCVYYGRDRGETGVEARVLSNAEKVDTQEYNYYYDGKEWYVDGNKLEDKLKRFKLIN